MTVYLTEKAIDVLADRTIENGVTEGLEWHISLIVEGAVDTEWIVDAPLGIVERLGERLAREVGRDYRAVLVIATLVYVGPDVIEASGYSPYLRWEG